ncbi:hypothetical protein NKDENANG_03658 [Candidatus Entotheonellaceae bacterium PAL068K]
MILLPVYPFLWQTASGLFRSRLAWEYTFSPPVVLGLALGLVLLIILQWRDLRRRVSLGTCWGLCLLRSFAYVLVLGMCLNPTLLIQKVLRLLPPLAVLVDSSGSMALPATEEKSRLHAALAYLRGEPSAPLQALTEHYQVKLYQFADTAYSVPLERLETLQGNGQTTDIVESLVAVLEENRATPPVGVLLLSDGAHHGPTTGLEYVRQAGLPVVTVGLGRPDIYRDIRIASVQAPTLTFLHYPVTVTATLHAWGYRDAQLPVVLKRAGRVVATQTVQVDTDVFQQQLQFDITPEAVGEFTYSISVAPRLGEALSDNNARDFPVSVARDKIRVLLVCGSPTWNYRFLRQAFKHDPSIDLISFVILRTPTDVANVPESQLSLIPFPTRRLFTKELQNFDLVVFENFSFQSYIPRYYLENVRQYVLEGGAFAMIGGRLAFARGGYTGTPIEEILPVALRKDRNDYRPVTQRMLLTPEGQAHPITRLSADAQENRHIWETMPALDALNLAGHVKPEATVLGVSTQRFGEAQNVPLLAVQRFGKGRTLALLSDYIWKWNFHMAGRMDSNQHYLQFIRQMVRWLIRDPILKQVRVMADASEFPVGSEITGTFQILQDDYRPASEAVLRTTLHTPKGTELAVHYVPTGNPGEYRYRIPATEAGFYELDVQAQINDKTHEANRLLLRVYRPGGENQHTAPNHPFLQDIADRTDGTFFALHDPARPTMASLVEFFGGVPGYQVLEERRFRLRETLPLFLVLLGCLAVEWWWRRRAGLF